MRLVFVMIHAAIAHLQHIRIIPVPRSGVLFQTVLAETNHRHAIILVLDISGGAPQVASRRSPGPGRINSPVANAEYDGSSSLRESVAKFCILHLGIKALRGAPIYFHVVHAPSGVGLSVLEFMVIASRLFLAG